MMKEIITPKIKNRFLEEVRIAKANGRERGFFLCKDEKGNVIPARTCEEEQCDIAIEDPFSICPKGFKGDIHVKPYITATKKYYHKKGIIIPPEDKLKERVIQNLKKRHEEKGLPDLPVVSPSYTDTLNSVLLKCFKNIDSVTCIGSDIEENKLNCWTPIKEIRKGHCVRALYDQRKIFKEKNKKMIQMFPKKWIVPLFEKEVINLK
jgi:hypothetical protein